MSLSQFFSILRARAWLMALVMLLTAGATLGVSLLLPRQYTATASVVIDFKPDPITAAVYGASPPPAVMATQVDIITSERVALKVVRTLRLNENANIRSQWLSETGGAGTLEQWLVQQFQKNLEVLPARESSVLRVTYRSPDPRYAAVLANAFVAAYTATALELRVNPAKEYAQFFDAQVKSLRDAYEEAQNKLSAFQKRNGIIATDERLDVETSRLTELSSQVVALQAISAESRSRQMQASAGDGDRMQEVIANPLVAGLRADVGRLEAKLQELDARLGDKHPQVIETKANLASLKSRLELETRRVTSSVAVTNSINQEREGQIRASLEAQRDKVLRMKAVRDEGLVLQRDVETAQRAFEAVQARLSQTNLESRTTQSNINVLTEATPPVDPSSPRILLNTALSLVFGVILAAAAALLLELLDRRVRTVEDLVSSLDLLVVGTMPRPARRFPLWGRRWTQMQQRLMAPLPGRVAGG
jgi:polysaccharide biosynthesis transport protein